MKTGQEKSHKQIVKGGIHDRNKKKRRALQQEGVGGISRRTNLKSEYSNAKNVGQ